LQDKEKSTISQPRLPSLHFSAIFLSPHNPLSPPTSEFSRTVQMERRRSLSDHSFGSAGRREPPRAEDIERGISLGSAINFPGNMCFMPRVAFKMAMTTKEIEERRWLLSRFALLVKEEGPLSLRCPEELKNVMLHHFGIRKHEIYIHCSTPEPFTLIFTDQHTRDIVFGARRLIDGPVELSFVA
jgi:hypothetical protein